MIALIFALQTVIYALFLLTWAKDGLSGIDEYGKTISFGAFIWSIAKELFSKGE